MSYITKPEPLTQVLYPCAADEIRSSKIKQKKVNGIFFLIKTLLHKILSDVVLHRIYFDSFIFSIRVKLKHRSHKTYGKHFIETYTAGVLECLSRIK